MKPSHALQTWLARGMVAGLRPLSWQRARKVGERIGDLARVLGVRRSVAARSLAQAFPERSAAEREELLCEHYRELGRVIAEYARLADLARAPLGEAVAAVRGLEHLLAARDAGRGVILLTGHFGNFELLGAVLGQTHPVDFVVRSFSNPGVEAMMAAERARAGVGLIDAGAGVRRVYAALRANHWVAMLADQDARRHGVFVPFLGRLASTPVGPARLALAAGAPIVMGFTSRRPDGRLELDLEPPLEIPAADAPDAVERLTALHVARLEHWVRRHPAMWFWLHRRWKTPAPDREPGARGTIEEPARG